MKNNNKAQLLLVHTKVYGLENAIKKSGNSMRPTIDNTKVNDQDKSRAKRLSNTPIGSGHDQFLVGAIVQFDITAPLYWWKQAQRYNWLSYISSSSSMHCLINKNPDRQFNLEETCNKYVWKETLLKINKTIEKYNATEDEKKKENLWYEVISNLPCGFMLSASMTTNYRQLKTIYSQRKHHRLKEWKIFCKWIESLPHSELITGDLKECLEKK